MRRIGESKRGLSNLVAYVLLISITLSLSVMVYGWLESYVGGDNVDECPSNVEIMIEGYTCYSGEDGELVLRLKNKGLFDIDGFIVRVHDEDYAEFGFYVFDDRGVALGTGERHVETYEFSDPGVNPSELSDITLIDVQPFLSENGKISCKAYASQRAVCYDRFVYDGFALGESFYDLEDEGRIDIAGTSACEGTGVCKISNDPASITFKTSAPVIPTSGEYNVTYNVELDSGVSYENYSVSCGGSNFPFSDDNSIDGRVNVSVLCDFVVGVNHIVFETVTDTGSADIEFYYLKIEGPLR